MGVVTQQSQRPGVPPLCQSPPTRGQTRQKSFPQSPGEKFSSQVTPLKLEKCFFYLGCTFGLFEPREVKKFNKKELSCSFQIISK